MLGRHFGVVYFGVARKEYRSDILDRNEETAKDMKELSLSMKE